jgi:hypothetical protein
MELTPTMHGAMIRVTFPPNAAMGQQEDTERRFCFAEAQDWSNGVSEEGKVPYITAKSLQVKQDRMIVTNFAMHIRAGTFLAHPLYRVSIYTFTDIEITIIRFHSLAHSPTKPTSPSPSPTNRV